MHDPLSQYLNASLAAVNPGLPLDQLQMVVCLLACYPLAYIQSLLPRQSTIQHVFGLIPGLYMSWFMFGYQTLHLIGTTLAAYVILSVVDRRYSQRVVFVFMMGYIFAAHAYRMYTDYMGWSMDFTGPFMMLVIKMTAMAFNFHDGSYKNTDALDAHQRSHRLAQLPSLLEFYGWVFSYLGFLVGPASELKDYLGMTTGALWADGKSKKGGKNQIPAGRFFAAGKVFIGGIICVVIGQVMTGYLDSDFINSDYYRHELWLPYRVLALLFFCIGRRMPYYFAWKMSEGACILAGLGYSGTDKDGNAEWNGKCNANVIQVETSMNVKTVTDGWNLHTAHWLNHYIYARVKTTSFKAFDVYITMTVSAVWHGLYAGYYLSFVTASLLVNTARLARRVCRPHFMEADGKTGKPTKIVYDIVTFVLHQIVFNYTMIPFVLLDFADGVAFWKSLKFFGHIAMISGFVLFSAMGGHKKRSRKVQKTQ